MTAHDDIITALLGVLTPLGGELRLISRFAHPILANPTDDAFLFVPDLHLLSSNRQKSYQYGFNHRASGLLENLLRSLATLKNAWTGKRKLVTTQLGDFFDLWRELGPTQTTADLAKTELAGLRDILYRDPFSGTCLEATMLLGNHDSHAGALLPEIPMQLKAFNAAPGGKPFLFTTHGDCFDLFERFTPDSLKEFGLFFFGGVAGAQKYSIGDFTKVAPKINKPVAQLQNCIQAESHDVHQPDHLNEAAGAVKVTPGAALPTQQVRAVNRLDKPKRFNDYYRALQVYGGAGTDAEKVTVIVAGHTHEAGMLLCAPTDGARPLLLVDAGAWIERCKYRLAETGKEVEEPSAQLAVVHGNDARIYQVRVP